MLRAKFAGRNLRLLAIVVGALVAACFFATISSARSGLTDTAVASVDQSPRVHALRSSGKAGAKVRFNYRVSDDSGKSHEQIDVFKNGQRVKRLYTALSNSKPGITYVFAWNAPRWYGGAYRFCVTAWDAAGNRSNTSCARLSIQKAGNGSNGGGGGGNPPPPPTTTDCSDGIDNDADGATDTADSGCSSSTDTDETTASYQCDDGVDNDSDGKTDYPDDPDCSSRTDSSEAAPAPAPNCDPSYPTLCLDPNASDYDCAGGSGDGPLYVYQTNFPVYSPDPFGLDGDGDGLGCEA